MAKDTVSEALLQIRASTDQLRSDMRRGEGQLRTGLASMQALAIRLAPVLSIAGIAAFVRQTVQATAALQDSADRIGINVEALQEYRFAGEQAGIATNQTDLALQRFLRRTAQAVQGTGELTGIFKQYNIALKEADGSTRNAEDVLLDLADATHNETNAQQQLLIAFKAFDSEGAAWVNVLRRGREGMKEAAAEARRMNAVIGEDLVRSTQRAAREFETAIAGMKNSLTLGLLPFITAAIVGFQRLFNLGRQNQIRTRLGEIEEETKTLSSVLPRLEENLARVNEQLNMAAPANQGMLETLTKRREAIEKEIERLKGLAAEHLKLREELIRLEGVESGSTGGGAPTPPPADTSAASKRKSFTETLNRQIETLQLEEARLRGGDEAMEALRRTMVETEAATLGLTNQTRPLLDQIELLQESVRGLSREITMIDWGAIFPEDIGDVEEGFGQLGDLIDQFEEFGTERMRAIQEEMESAVDQIGDSITSGITETLRGAILGTQELDEAMANMARNMALSLAEATFELLVMQPLLEKLKTTLEGIDLGGLGGGGGGGGGGFGGFVKSIPVIGPLLGGIFHEGGTVGPGGRRLALPSLDIPSFHSGGLVGPGEALIRAEQGETIRTPAQEAALRDRMRGGDGVGITINERIIVEGDIVARGKFTEPKDVIRISRETVHNDLTRTDGQLRRDVRDLRGPR